MHLKETMPPPTPETIWLEKGSITPEDLLLKVAQAPWNGLPMRLIFAKLLREKTSRHPNILPSSSRTPPARSETTGPSG